MHVLDSTDPRANEGHREKSGSVEYNLYRFEQVRADLEPNIFKQYFYERVKSKVGEKEVGNRFIAVTDPGSKMQKVAEGDNFRHLSWACQASVDGILAFEFRHGTGRGDGSGRGEIPQSHGRDGAHACGQTVPADGNPGVVLGAIMGVAANNGRDKLTIIASPGILRPGGVVEQLLADPLEKWVRELSRWTAKSWLSRKLMGMTGCSCSTCASSRLRTRIRMRPWMRWRRPASLLFASQFRTRTASARLPGHAPRSPHQPRSASAAPQRPDLKTPAIPRSHQQCRPWNRPLPRSAIRAIAMRSPSVTIHPSAKTGAPTRDHAQLNGIGT